ncbi:MAG: ATP-binding protein [Bacteroidota bacterium]
MNSLDKSKEDLISELHESLQENISLLAEKEKEEARLIIANKELAFQNDEKGKRAAELIIANKELLFQNKEKEKRAAELVIANKELLFQNEEKEKRAAELVIANKELLFQNEEKEKRAAELVIAKEKAEESDRLKTAFLNNISHEIRTPLNSILGFAPFIIQPGITTEEKEEYLEILDFSSTRLINTITDLMDISLIISGNMEVHPHSIVIASLLTNVYEHFQRPFKKINLGLRMQFPDHDDQFILITDEEMLRKAVSKLVDNSLKFTKEGGVTLGFELKNNEIEIFIKDTGVGIEEDLQERIWENFMQGNPSNSRGYEGSGLGLSIAKGLTQLLGGKIRLESTKDVGTTVFLSLPDYTATISSIQIF